MSTINCPISESITDSYSNWLERAHIADNIPYVGPRAIFDLNFIPPSFFPRKSLALKLSGILQDAISDHYSGNITLYGLQGTGKNLHVNHFLDWYKRHEQYQDLKMQPKIIRINCTSEDSSQFMHSFLVELATNLGIALDISVFVAKSPATLWNSIKLLLRKQNAPIIIFLQETEYIDHAVISRILTYCKTLPNVQVINSINTGSRKYNFSQYQNLDYKIPFNIYDSRNLMEIADERNHMVFENPIPRESVALIMNLVSEFDTKVPGNIMKFYREIYPHVQQDNENFTAEKIREISQYFFDGYSIDAVSIADFVFNTSFEDRLFLDYLIHSFKDEDAFITLKNVRNSYKMACEEMGFQYNVKDFKNSLHRLTESQLLRPGVYFSENYNQDTMLPSITEKSEKNQDSEYFFICMPSEQILEIMDASFGDLI